MRGLVCATAFAVLVGCTQKSVRPGHQPPPAHSPRLSSNYIDLQAGWRLRVVTPLLRSGGYQLHPTAMSMSGNTINVQSGDDFIGYETSYYEVKSRRGAGVRIRFSRAEVTIEGETSPRRQPRERLFRVPRGLRFVRLIYLQRASHVDHDMAVTAARRLEELDALTKRVKDNPAESCTTAPSSFCAWIPAGIAVRPEILRTKNGLEEWVPAR